MTDALTHNDNPVNELEYLNAGHHKVTNQAKGDIIYAADGSVISRIPIGATNQIMNVSGGIPAWTSSPTLNTITATTLNAPTGRTASYVIAAYDAPTNVRAQSDYPMPSAGADLSAVIIATIAAGNRNIQLTEGTFAISNTIYYKGAGNIVINGAGMGSYPEGQTAGMTVLNPTTQPFAYTDPFGGQGCVFDIEPSSINGSVTLSNLKIAMTSAAINQINGIYAVGAAIYLSNILITYPNNGIFFNVADNIQLNNVWVRAFTGTNGRYGFAFGNVSDFEITNCKSEGSNEGTGFNFSGCANGGLVNCRSDTSRQGFYFSGCSQITATNLQEYHSLENGILVGSSSNHITITGGWSQDGNTEGYGGGQSAGVRLNNVTYCTITGMQITDDRGGSALMAYGVYEDTGSNYNNITNNIIYGMTTTSIVKVGVGTLVQGNVGGIVAGEIRSVSGSLVAGTTGQISFAWHNPENTMIWIRKVVVWVATGGGTGGSLGQVGRADDAAGTNIDSGYFTAIPLNSTGYYDSWNATDTGSQLKWGVLLTKSSGSAGWIDMKITVQNASSLVGTYYIEYEGAQ